MTGHAKDYALVPQLYRALSCKATTATPSTIAPISSQASWQARNCHVLDVLNTKGGSVCTSMWKPYTVGRFRLRFRSGDWYKFEWGAKVRNPERVCATCRCRSPEMHWPIWTTWSHVLAVVVGNLLSAVARWRLGNISTSSLPQYISHCSPHRWPAMPATTI